MLVLVVGKKGQLGSHLFRVLKQSPDLDVIEIPECDITNKFAINNRINQSRPDVIVNAAAYTCVEQAEMEKEIAFNVNNKGACLLAQASKDIGAMLIHMSTDYVFDGSNKHAYKENDVPNPQSIYGKSKLAGEAAIVNTCPRHIIIRTAWLFSVQDNNFVSTMLTLGRDRDELSIVDDQYGGPTYVGDLANAILHIMMQFKQVGRLNWGVYHFSGFPYVTWYQFAQHIFKQAHKQKTIDKPPRLVPISSQDYPSNVNRPANSTLNCTKIERELGIEMVDWSKALPVVIEQFMESQYQ
ncbi:dTDP-4-dehydrorhamnose reductase [uncultured Shewanella sp.]|uniref:dTDP-4-dehydrorhamnose reductase n=1 Tax=uncultured Shewanella sp. TaxID=173975 RepID=UPI002612D9B5|nr:dTDP-4-dehydrorhamnose reductase [uncultured Shewanella sp.]